MDQNNDFDRVRWYVLTNCNEIAPYLSKFSNGLCVLPITTCYNFSIDNHLPIRLFLIQWTLYNEANFDCWFHKRLYNSRCSIDNGSKQLYDLACGPDRHVRSYRCCIVNGVRYHMKEYAETHTTQNIGIFVSGDDGNSVTEYYGELKNILELCYPS
jgi:hypothetical protein